MNNIAGDRVRVRIYGRDYEMESGGLTPLEVQSLASFVDEKMREISEKFALADTGKIAVLAAMNIALDYLQMKERMHPDSSDTLSPRLQTLSQILDKALQS